MLTGKYRTPENTSNLHFVGEKSVLNVLAIHLILALFKLGNRASLLPKFCLAYRQD